MRLFGSEKHALREQSDAARQPPFPSRPCLHLTHRCHMGDFLLKFGRDRNNYRRWLYEARKRFQLCLFDYVVTSNV
jgi:hypothetical protein